MRNYDPVNGTSIRTMYYTDITDPYGSAAISTHCKPHLNHAQALLDMTFKACLEFFKLIFERIQNF